MRFRKKPVVIDAIQLTWRNWNDICDFCEVGKLLNGRPEGCYLNDEGKPVVNPLKPTDKMGLLIPTLEGLMVGIEGDWIIKGIKGEFYIIKNEIFLETYEPLE